MTGNSLVLDTSTVADLFRKNVQVVQVVARTPNIYIPVTVLGELYLGAYRSANQAKKLKEISDFLLTCSVVELNHGTASVYAQVKASLLSRGRPIPENDIWIAAAAIQHNLPLYTNDAHFREVEGLNLFDPLSPV